MFIVGKSKEEHNFNLRSFLQRARNFNLSLNSETCAFNQPSLTFLGHKVEEGQVKPDPERLEPVRSFPIPKCKKELERLLGLLVYYSEWINNFAGWSHPLFEAKQLGIFLLPDECVNAITTLKNQIADATVTFPISNVPLDLETDASTKAIGAVLSPNGQPKAFFSPKSNSGSRSAGLQLSWRLMLLSKLSKTSIITSWAEHST